MGGEKKKSRRCCTSIGGSPPRGRGKGLGHQRHGLPCGITPAWAGKSTTGAGFLLLSVDHPRVGGEKRASYLPGGQLRGSPPRGRGKAGRPRCRARHLRITPAWAGKRSLAGLRPGRPGDHPRVGGEKTLCPGPYLKSKGSPPHGRGKDEDGSMAEPLEGITPA